MIFTSSDPLHILASTKPIVDNSRLVTINPDAIEDIDPRVQERLKEGLDDPTTGLGLTGNIETDINLVLIEDFVNFCFWAEKGKPKWTVEWPTGTFQDGWYGLVACFRRALEEGTPILDASYLTSLTLKQVENLFHGSNNAEIPLLEKRLDNLCEAGNIINKQYDGSLVHWLTSTDYDAVKIVESLASNFSCFRDVATHNNKPVYFYKRAQWAAHALSCIPGITITNLDSLAALADYKLPQILRHFGVLSYAPELASQIDSYTLIPEGSIAEIELRAATIWVVELLRQEISTANALDIDNALWLLSQNIPTAKPYHRTYTIYY